MTQNLRIPGPTSCPEETLEELSSPDDQPPRTGVRRHAEADHGRLKTFFRTENDVFVFTTSGTGAMEAAIVNTLSAGDTILGRSIGEFGDRFIDIAEAYGADVTRLDFEPGTRPTRRPSPTRWRRTRDQGRPRHPQRDLDRRHQRRRARSARRSAP